MKIVVSMDSFKGSMSSWDAGNAAKAGIEKAFTDLQMDGEVIVFPLADGGEGTVEAIVAGNNGEFRTMDVQGPLGDETSFLYGILPDGKIVMEMAQAAGLTLVAEADRNPMKTSTYGLGQAIAEEIRKADGKPVKFMIGIGGSATNDCGIGMMQALGYRFLDENGNELAGCGENLAHIAEIDDTHVIAGLDQCEFEIANDVKNPLYGEEGAAYVYGAQKGADEDMMAALDDGMHNFADVVFWYNATDETQTEGAGAAGGLGYAFLSFFNATFTSGADLVIEASKIRDEIMEGVDLIVTGEGCLDEQTLNGKGPAKAAELAKKDGIPVIAIGGMLGEGYEKLYDIGIDVCVSIMDHMCSQEEAMSLDTATKELTNASEQVIRLLNLGKSLATKKK